MIEIVLKALKREIDFIKYHGIIYFILLLIVAAMTLEVTEISFIVILVHRINRALLRLF